ncbi:FRG domain-containing protein [Paraburkholderia sp. BCC1885]|uniref:FRG domain-containing protein n=1 Tax=Paraburkholderia sp. BCC1885 TaxID=2562669 RepID=UPI001184506B|nr:FRG domain-containing protein [Paraburkholderia sp. BCC1885]
MTDSLKDYDSLDDFWNAISPIGEIFGQQNFIYRGHRDSAWGLVPPVYRQDIIDKYKGSMPWGRPDHSGQIYFEYMLLQSFVHHCDLRGLPVPFDSMDFRNYFEFPKLLHNVDINPDAWRDPKLWPIMALAQHHGVPTRLLDWSSNSMVACYFAASRAVTELDTYKEKITKDTRIAVFGFTFSEHRPDTEYKYVKVPGSISVNIPAQSGSFILVNNSGFGNEDFSVGVSLETQLHYADKLIKLTLPVSLAGDLLMRCHKFGVSAASIFPGYDGVAKAVLERNLANSFVDRLA